MKVPTTLDQDRYRLEGMLGEGGMAQVFRAHDEHLGVWRAIKVLSPAMAGKERLEKRFLREARTMARLEHPNIVRVLDVRREAGLPYMVMELVSGGSLDDHLQRSGAVSSVRALGIMEQVLAAIGYSHSQGVVHRDIKPGNILDDGEGNCRVTDFGIAQIREDGLSSHTRTGSVMGTWGYMAPEQRRDAKNIDERADIYSLGALLYVLVTGHTPMELFAAATVPGLMDAVPAPLVPIITTACAFEPDKRYATCAAFQLALQAVAPQLGLGAPPPKEPRQAMVPDASHRVTLFPYGDDTPVPAAPVAADAPVAPADVPAHRPSRSRGPLMLVAAAVVVAGGLVWMLEPSETRPVERAPVKQAEVVAMVEPVAGARPAQADAVEGERVYDTPAPVATPKKAASAPVPAKHAPGSAVSKSKPTAQQPPLEPAERLARVREDGKLWDKLFVGDTVDPALSLEVGRVIRQRYDKAADRKAANGLRTSLLYKLGAQPKAGADFVRVLGEGGELTAFLASASLGQGGDFSDPILGAMSQHAPASVKQPDSLSDCRSLLHYVDVLHRPEVKGAPGEDWIGSACRACTVLNGGEPMGKCDA